jgi:hypothetical protein
MPSDVSQSLRDFVKERANNRCEYCLMPNINSQREHEIEHILPRKHEGESVSENLAWACWRCNRHKGSDVGTFDSETTAFTFFYNPRTQIWAEHFRLENAMVLPLTAEARVTVRLLRFNDAKRIEERHNLIEANLF